MRVRSAGGTAPASAAASHGGTLKPIATVLILLAVAAACSGQSSEKRGARIGGCEIDTISIGTGLVRAAVPRGGAARIDLLSVAPAGENRFREAAQGLLGTLDSLGVPVYSRSELLHVARGPCWPAFRVTLLFDAKTPEESEAIRRALEAAPLAGAPPVAKRPKGYGTFFVTCGRGDRDWWTVWYR
jgi:hypothetical protein